MLAWIHHIIYISLIWLKLFIQTHLRLKWDQSWQLGDAPTADLLTTVDISGARSCCRSPILLLCWIYIWCLDPTLCYKMDKATTLRLAFSKRSIWNHSPHKSYWSELLTQGRSRPDPTICMSQAEPGHIFLLSAVQATELIASDSALVAHLHST